jgi:hypothetical protein
MIVFLEPPAQYDHPYTGRVIEQRLSRLQIMVTCHGPAESCSWVGNGVCYIALPQGESDLRLIAYIRQQPDAKRAGPANGRLKLELE